MSVYTCGETMWADTVVELDDAVRAMGALPSFRVRQRGGVFPHVDLTCFDLRDAMASVEGLKLVGKGEKADWIERKVRGCLRGPY